MAKLFYAPFRMENVTLEHFNFLCFAPMDSPRCWMQMPFLLLFAINISISMIEAINL